jgi:hypothetical protein
LRITTYNDYYAPKVFRDKHSYMPPPSVPITMFSEPSLVVEVDIVLMCIKLFSKGPMCGKDGLLAQYLVDALCVKVWKNTRVRGVVNCVLKD